MHTMLSSLLSVTLLLSNAAFAAPTKRQEGGSFKVDRVQNLNYTRNPQTALRRAYQKFNWTLPEELKMPVIPTGTIQESATGSAETGEAANTPESFDSEYLAPVTIGGQTLMMDFDTGSSDLWVFSSELPSDQSAGHTVFNPAHSSTFTQSSGSTFSIKFGDSSSASGVVGTDTVNIGGATVTSQAVELATQVSSSFVQDIAADGLVGLAFSSINTVKPNAQKTFLDNVKSSLLLPVFTANLKHATAGAYEFGAIDSSKFTGSITYTAVDTSRGFWEFPASGFSIGNGPQQPNTENSPAIADTGTSLLLADKSIVDAYYAQVAGANFDIKQAGYVFDCSASLPNLNLMLGSKSYVAKIPSSLMVYEKVDSNTCFGALQETQQQGLQIYGDILFKAQFVVFDAANNALGFAPHA